MGLNTETRHHSFAKNHITHMKLQFEWIRTAHTAYAENIYEEYKKRKGHSWYGMKALETLREYNRRCLAEFSELEKNLNGKAIVSLVGSTRYEVAIPGISDVDGVVLFKTGTTIQELAQTQQKVEDISTSYGFKNNVFVQAMDSSRYTVPQMLYPLVFRAAMRKKTTHNVPKIDLYLHQLAFEHGGLPDVIGWNDELEKYSDYFIAKDKTPATYANRLINVVGLQNFTSVEDWDRYREQQKNAPQTRPFDEEELAQMEVFCNEGY